MAYAMPTKPEMILLDGGEMAGADGRVWCETGHIRIESGETHSHAIGKGSLACTCSAVKVLIH